MSFNKGKLSLRKQSSRQSSSFKNYREEREENYSRDSEHEGNSSDSEHRIKVGKRGHMRAASVNDRDAYKRLEASYKSLSNDYKQLQTQNIDLEHRIRQLEMGGAPLGPEPTENTDEQISRKREIEVLTSLKKDVNALTKQLLLSDLDGEILTSQVSKYLQDLQLRNEFLEDKVDSLEKKRLQLASKNQTLDSDMNQMSMQLMKLTKEKKSAEKKLLSVTADNSHLNELVRDLRNEIERLNLFTSQKSKFGSDLPNLPNDLPNIPDVKYKKPPPPHARANSFNVERKHSSLRKAAVHGRTKSAHDRRKRSSESPNVTSPRSSSSSQLLQGRKANSPSLEDDEAFGSVKDFLLNDPEWTEDGLWGVKIETQVNARSEIRVIKHWKFTTSDGSAHQVQLMHVQDRFRTDSMREIIIDSMPQYRKKSNAGNFHFKINNDDVVLTIQTLANGWTYELILNGNLWRTARELVEAIE